MFDYEISSIYKYLLKNKGFYFNIQLLNFIKKHTRAKTFKTKEKFYKELILKFDEILKYGTGTEMLKAIELKTILELGL